MKTAGKAYQKTKKGRDRQRARSLDYYYRRGRDRRRQRRAEGAGASGMAAAPEELRQPEEAPAHADGRSESKPRPETPAMSSENQDVSGEGGGGHPRECLTHKRGCEAGLSWATLEPAQAVSSAQEAASRRAEEAVDAKTPSCRGIRESRDKEPEPPATDGVAPCDAETSRPALGPVLTTAAQVRAALEHAFKVGHQDGVVWGRCARCGRVGRVVHFDGALRARARAP